MFFISTCIVVFIMSYIYIRIRNMFILPNFVLRYFSIYKLWVFFFCIYLNEKM